MKARLAAIMVLALGATAVSAQQDLNNQAITRQNPINSPLPTYTPPPLVPLPPSGAVANPLAGTSLGRTGVRTGVRVDRVRVDRVKVVRKAEKGRRARAAERRQRGGSTHVRAATEAADKTLSNPRWNICRGC